jgi:hypothetical protein
MELTILDEGEFWKPHLAFSVCQLFDDIIFILGSSMVQEIALRCGWVPTKTLSVEP